VHRFVHPQALDVGKRNTRMATFWHLFRVVQTLERDVLRAGKRIGELDQRAQRKADPRHHNRPGLDAAMTINTLFEGCDLQEHIQIEHLRFGNCSLD